jgi:hypothetical protein
MQSPLEGQVTQWDILKWEGSGKGWTGNIEDGELEVYVTEKYVLILSYKVNVDGQKEG